MNKFLMTCVLVTLVSGCSSVSTTDRPDSYYSGDRNTDSKDLFASGSELSDQQIENILNYRLQLPVQNRIALLKLSESSYWRYYSNDINAVTPEFETQVINKLKRSDRVYDVSFLPSMLIPEKRTIPYLREAAARYQADLLLLYRTSCRSYQDYNMISPDETRAVCTVEAAVLDIRKGVVPFTSVSSNTYSAFRNKDDANFYQTRKNAELKSIALAMGEVAEDLLGFLGRMSR